MTTEAPSLGDAAPRSRVAPTFGRGLLVALIYAAVFLTVQLISGVDYDAINESTSNVFGFVVLPVGLGILVSLAVTATWGWWRALFHDTRPIEGHRWVWIVPALMVGVVLAQLVSAPWHEFSTGLTLLLLVGCLLVGFGEEIVFRGYLLVGARGNFSERGVWFVTSLCFGLFHGLNLFTGQDLPTTIKQIVVAFIMGGAFYLLRRLSGLLILCMILHGLWDFSTFLAAGRGDEVPATPEVTAAVPLSILAILTTIAALIAVFRRGGGEPVS